MAEQPSGSDRRITNIIIRHWNEVRGMRKYPSEKDLDPVLLEELLDNCFLVKVEGLDEGKFNYKFIGKNIMNAYGSDLTKQMDVHKPNPLTYKDKIDIVRRSGQPLSDEGEFFNVKGHTVKYRQCIVPLSSDGVNIDSIFGGMRYIVVES